MTSITIDVLIAHDVHDTWDELRHIERHVTWMSDAQRIDFHSDQREGVGTTFDCRTKIGPFTTTDAMTITHWETESTMGVTHHGLFVGSGEFNLVAVGNSTRLSWTESIRFPWWMGARLGEWIARPLLRHIWRTNLESLAQIIALNSGGDSPTT